MNPGDRFLHFYIEGFIGRGNFGDVYIAGNMLEGRRVALKVVRKGIGEEEEAKYAAEVYGAKLQKALQDPGGNVAKVFDYGVDEATGALYIEMEYVEGDDLSTLIRAQTNPPEPEQVAIIGESLCGLLAWLAQEQVEIDGRSIGTVVHGDLKPGNVRIERATGKVKVLDFGIARALKETMVTMPFNSPAYTSPERLESGKADLQSDLWAVGVMLYELMMGHLPFHAENRELLEKRIRAKEPPAPLPSNYPASLRVIVQRMLRRDPADRFATPEQAQRAFTSFLQGGGMDETVRDTSTRERDPDPTIRASQPRGTGTQRADVGGWASPRNMRLAMFGVFGFLCVSAVASGYMTYQKGATLARELQNEHLTDMDVAWKQYQALQQDTWFPAMLFSAKNAVKQKLIAGAYQIVDEYRIADAPVIRERQWRQAATYLGRALEIDTSDKTILAGLRLSEGHLARIQMSSQAARRDSTVRQKYANTAVQKFMEAASLRPKWPDPYLGLARLYTYEVTDLERAMDAMDKAEKFGHRMGRREQSQLADAHRRMVDRYWDESRKVRELPDEEKRLLEDAKDHCKSASRLYQDVGVFQNAVASHKLLMMRCQSIDERLEEMKDEPKEDPRSLADKIAEKLHLK